MLRQESVGFFDRVALREVSAAQGAEEDAVWQVPLRSGLDLVWGFHWMKRESALGVLAEDQGQQRKSRQGVVTSA